jgi:phospholipid/cholesterol/gamma-HCH transport system substrate-binding protein
LRYLKEEILAGTIVLVAIALFAFVVVIIGGTTTSLEEVKTYRVRFADATGLEPRAPVRLNGLYAGKVLRVSIPEDDLTKVEATIGIKQNIPIFNTARASVTSLSIIGDYYLALSQKQVGRPLPPGSVIPSEEAADFQHLIVNTSELSKSMDQLLQSIRPVFAKENVRSLGEALRSVQPLITDVRRLTASVDGAVKRFDTVVKENRQPVSEAMVTLKSDLKKADSALSALDRLTHSLEGWQQVGGSYADDILQNLTKASENQRALSQELKEQPSLLLQRPEEPERGPK